MSCLHGHVDADPETVRRAVTASMDVLAVTEATADEAAVLQEALLRRGVPADHPDTLTAASAREHGGVFATADERFRNEGVQTELAVAQYDPY